MKITRTRLSFEDEWRHLHRDEAHAVAIVLRQCTVPGDSDDARERRIELANYLDHGIQ